MCERFWEVNDSLQRIVNGLGRSHRTSGSHYRLEEDERDGGTKIVGDPGGDLEQQASCPATAASTASEGRDNLACWAIYIYIIYIDNIIFIYILYISY